MTSIKKILFGFSSVFYVLFFALTFANAQPYKCVPKTCGPSMDVVQDVTGGGYVSGSRSISTGTGLSGGGDLTADRTISLADTVVTPGSYTASDITVDAQGRITAASSGSFVPDTRRVIAGTGLDGGGALSSDVTINLADTAVTAGSYTNTGLTVDAQGRITAASNGVSVEASTAAGQMLFGDGAGDWDHSETSEFLWDDTGKYFGIGAATPRRKLDLLDTANPQLRLTHTDNSIYTDLSTTSAGVLTVAPTSGGTLFPSGSATYPAIGFGDGDTGFYELADDTIQVRVGTPLLIAGFYNRQGMGGGSVAANKGLLSVAAATATAPAHTFVDDTNTGIGRANADQVSIIAGGTESIRATATSSNMGLVDSYKTYWGAGQDMSVYYDGTSGYIKTDEVAASDLHITTGAAKTIVYDTPVYDDLNFDPENGGPVATRPDDVTINNVFHVEFTSANNQLCGASGELPHKYKLGTDLTPHIHIFLKSGESAGTTGVTFTFYWELRQSTGTTSGNLELSTTSAQLGTTAGANNFHVYGTAFAGSAELGGQLAVTIARTAGDAGDVVATTYGVHYQIDTPGSRTITTK